MGAKRSGYAGVKCTERRNGEENVLSFRGRTHLLCVNGPHVQTVSGEKWLATTRQQPRTHLGTALTLEAVKRDY